MGTIEDPVKHPQCHAGAELPVHCVLQRGPTPLSHTARGIWGATHPFRRAQSILLIRTATLAPRKVSHISETPDNRQRELVEGPGSVPKLSWLPLDCLRPMPRSKGQGNQHRSATPSDTNVPRT